MTHGWPEGSWGEYAQQDHPEPKKSSSGDRLPFKNVSARTRRQQVNNVKGAIQHATPEEYLHGMTWYQSAQQQIHHEVGSAIDAAQSRRMARAVGGTAKLSPSGGGMTWERNPGAARTAARMTDTEAAKVRYGNRSPVVGTNLRFASNPDIEAAHAILHGHAEPEDVLTTRKIGHFYTNLNYPSGNVPKSVKSAHPDFYNKVDPKGATIDSRADSILKGRHMAWGTRAGLDKQGRYDYESGVYKQAAGEMGLPHAHQGQAISWTVGERYGRKGGGRRMAHGEALPYVDYRKPPKAIEKSTQVQVTRLSGSRIGEAAGAHTHIEGPARHSVVHQNTPEEFGYNDPKAHKDFR